MNKYDNVLWDWNGTLLDDLQMNIDLADDMLSHRGLPPIESKNFYLENFGFPIVNFYALTGFDLKNEDFEAVSEEYAAEYQKRLSGVKLFSDVQAVLCALKNAGIRQAVVSATEHEMLISQVSAFGIDGYFDEVLGTGNKMGQGKVGTALDFLERSKISPRRTVFIGDTVHDHETAEAIGCDCVLVCRGHNSRQRLVNTGRTVCENLVEALKEIL